MTAPRATRLGLRHGVLYRLVAFATRWQLRRVLRSVGNRQLAVVGFAVFAGTVALGTITLAAIGIRLPLLFPPLAPSAFILFTTPLAAAASPRSVVLAHTLAVLVGLAALHTVQFVFPLAGLADPAVLNGYRIIVIALAMAGITSLMLLLRCAHPPAAASALIAAMGYLDESIQALGLILAACLLALEAILLNRVVSGLPYPLWRPTAKAARGYGILTGSGGAHGASSGSAHAGYWGQLSEKLLQNRRRDGS